MKQATIEQIQKKENLWYCDEPRTGSRFEFKIFDAAVIRINEFSPEKVMIAVSYKVPEVPKLTFCFVGINTVYYQEPLRNPTLEELATKSVKLVSGRRWEKVTDYYLYGNQEGTEPLKQLVAIQYSSNEGAAMVHTFVRVEELFVIE